MRRPEFHRLETVSFSCASKCKFNINVSFIEPCSAIVPHCTPVGASQYLSLPVLLNLLGYVVGTLVLSPMADRWGRRDMLLVTMLITGFGSLWTA